MGLMIKRPLLVLLMVVVESEALAFPTFVGFDLGTSGARISVIDSSFEELFSDSILWESYDDAQAWEDGIYHLLQQASSSSKVETQSIQSICVSGTSASCLMVDSKGQMTRAPRMYNYDVVASAATASPEFAESAMELLDRIAPPKHTARAKTSSLAKLLTWAKETALEEGEVLCHQSDYITMKLLMGGDSGGTNSRPGTISSDWHNCLKCGYDVQGLEWPAWVKECLEEVGASPHVVPQNIVSPGEVIGPVSEEFASRFNLSKDTVMVGGTTDSNAAFFAAIGGTSAKMGTAVTSLGSTLAIKQLSQAYVEDSSRGVYSHRFPSNDDNKAKWLIGGASNVGCAVLRQEQFSNEELVELSKEIDPNSDIDLSYYPLTKPGERFPIADSSKQPVLEPVPESRADYLKGILQAISDVERDGFRVMQELGADPPTMVWTSGGGSKNGIWSQMRQRKLIEEFGDDESISVKRADNVEASFGAATLAASTFV